MRKFKKIYTVLFLILTSCLIAYGSLKIGFVFSMEHYTENLLGFSSEKIIYEKMEHGTTELSIFSLKINQSQDAALNQKVLELDGVDHVYPFTAIPVDAKQVSLTINNEEPAGSIPFFVIIPYYPEDGYDNEILVTEHLAKSFFPENWRMVKGAELTLDGIELPNLNTEISYSAAIEDVALTTDLFYDALLLPYDTFAGLLGDQIMNQLGTYVVYTDGSVDDKRLMEDIQGLDKNVYVYQERQSVIDDREAIRHKNPVNLIAVGMLIVIAVSIIVQKHLERLSLGSTVFILFVCSWLVIYFVQEVMGEAFGYQWSYLVNFFCCFWPALWGRISELDRDMDRLNDKLMKLMGLYIDDEDEKDDHF